MRFFLVSSLDFLKKYVLSIFLFFYGLFYYISSSEFWPISISKTWLNLESFEYSLLQKPLFGLFLSSLHWFPLSNINHIFLVKIVFTLTGAFALYIFAKLLHTIADPNNLKKLNLSVTVLALILVSPVVLNNFFNIRTDQVAFLFFSLFLLQCEKKNIKLSLLLLSIIPLIGIKEIIFVIPGVPIYCYVFRKQFSKKVVFFSILTLSAVLVWAIGLNISSISYLIESYKNGAQNNVQISDYIKTEWPILFASVYIILLNLYKKINLLYSWVSLYFISCLFLFPQSTSFFIASIVPFIYMPLFIFFLNTKLHLIKFNIINNVIKLSVSGVLIAMQVFYILGLSYLYSKTIYPTIYPLNYPSNITQLSYIKETSHLLDQHNFSYLDGMGIFPKNKFIPCFISPYDDLANSSCVEKITDAVPDIIIVTSRLMFLGTELFVAIEKKYIQIYPNLWIKKEKVIEYIFTPITLDRSLVPVLIF